MRLRSLELQAFRSFGGPERIDFPGRGMLLLDGVDSATGESSGSGKSSILEAVAFAVGYSQMPATELQCRHSKLPMQVVLTLEVGGGEVVLARGAKNYYVAGGEKRTGAKEYAEFVQRTFGMPPDLVRALTYRAQREVGKFVSMPDSEKKEFLGMCIPELEAIERASEDARRAADALASDMAGAAATVASLEAESARLVQLAPSAVPAPLGDLEARRDNLHRIWQALDGGAVQTEEIARSKAGAMDEALLATLKEIRNTIAPDLAGVANARAEHLQTVVRLEADLARADAEGRAATARADADRRAVDEQIRGRRAGLEKLLAICAHRPHIAEAMEKVDRELADLAADTCPTCKRQWDNARAETDRLAAARADLEARVVMTAEARRRADHVAAEIDALEQSRKCVDASAPAAAMENYARAAAALASERARERDIDSADAKLSRRVEDGLQARRSELSVDVGAAAAAAQAARGAERAAHAELGVAALELGAAAKRNNEIGAEVARHGLAVGDAERRTALARQAADIMLGRAAMERAVHSSLGRTGYMGSIFDEILAEISREATAIVSGMPNTRSVSVAFSSAQETKKGTTRRSIAPTVCKDGLTASLKSLSGGQQTTVELAADLAIGAVVSRRTGRMPGWLALDEAFDGMGVPTKEICMDVLRRYAKDRLVIVVDHATEIKEAFDSQIVVDMVGGNSTIRKGG